MTPVLSLELNLCVFTGGGGFIVTPVLSLELYLCVFTGGFIMREGVEDEGGFMMREGIVDEGRRKGL